MHTPDKVQSVTPEKVGHEPDGPKKPQLCVTEDAGHFDCVFRVITEVLLCGVDRYFIPDVPLVVFQYFVENQGAEVQKVAQSGNED